MSILSPALSQSFDFQSDPRSLVSRITISSTVRFLHHKMQSYCIFLLATLSHCHIGILSYYHGQIQTSCFISGFLDFPRHRLHCRLHACHANSRGICHEIFFSLFCFQTTVWLTKNAYSGTVFQCVSYTYLQGFGRKPFGLLIGDKLRISFPESEG